MSNIKLDTKRLDAIAKQLNLKREQVCREFAFQVEGAIKGNNVPYDTGAMHASIYTNTKGHDGYSQAAGAAKARNPDAEVSPIPEPRGKIVATVGVGVNYAIYVELGTSRMGARPFFVSGVERIAQDFNDGKNWEELVSL